MTSLRRRLTPYALLAPGVGWLLVFFLVPMGFMLYLSLSEGTPSNLTFTGNFDTYTTAVSEYSTQFFRAFFYAGAATVISLLLGYPLAYAIAFKAGRWQYLMLFIVIAPFLTTYLMRVIAWKTILADNGPVVDVLKFIHIIPEDGRVLATSGAVIAGLTYNFLPFMVLPLYAALERLDLRLIEAAKDLYASAAKTFLLVTLPLTAPGILAGVLLTFIPAAGDYVNVDFLGGTGSAMIGNVIQSSYLKVGDYPQAAATSFVFMIVILVGVLFYIRSAGTEALMGDEGEGR